MYSKKAGLIINLSSICARPFIEKKNGGGACPLPCGYVPGREGGGDIIKCSKAIVTFYYPWGGNFSVGLPHSPLQA